MLDTLIASFKGLFSRGFWFGSFLPVAIFGSVHLLLAATQFPDAVPLVSWLSAESGAAIKIAPIAISAAVVLAYTLAPLVPMFRGLLDGTLLPPALLEALRRERLREARLGRDEMEDASDLSDRWNSLREELRQRLREARQAGAHLPYPPDDEAIKRVASQVILFRRGFAHGGVPELEAAVATAQCIATELRAANAGLPADAPGGNRARAMTQLQRRFLGALRDAVSETRYRRDSLYLRFADTALDHFRATEVGDVRERTESYSQQVYGVSFRFVWPRVQALLAKDDPLTERLGDAQSQIDFAVLCLALSVTVPLVWLPLLAFTAQRPWLFLSIGIATPFVLVLFSQLLLQSQIAFGTLVETAIDKYRLDVLTKLLRQPLPMTRRAEMELWSAVRIAADTRDTNRLSYRHATS